MKYDPQLWKEVKDHEKISHSKGWLRLRASAPCALFISAQGHEALYCYGTSFDVETAQAVIARIDGPQDIRVFMEGKPSNSVVFKGEVFTNIDRMPEESGTLAEVNKAKRLMQIEQRAFLKQVREENAATLAAIRSARPSVTPDDQVTDDGEVIEPEEVKTE